MKNREPYHRLGKKTAAGYILSIVHSVPTHKEMHLYVSFSILNAVIFLVWEDYENETS